MSVDELIKLGIAGDTEALERERERMFNEFIITVDDADRRRRLEGLHFRMKNIRYKYKNPLAACIASYEIMMNSFNELNQMLNNQ